jgi:hypothetical protein
MKHQLPEYSISASRISAAEECNIGNFFFEMTDATMAASFKVQPVYPFASAYNPLPMHAAWYLEHRKHNPLEESTGLENGAAERLVIVRMQCAAALVRALAHVLPDGVEQDALEEDARLRRLHLRNEDARRRMRCLRGPLLWPCECKDARPRGQGRDDLEWFRQRT